MKIFQIVSYIFVFVSISIVITLSTFCYAEAGVYKGEDESMFLDPTKPGWSTNVAVQGTGKGQESGLVVVIKNGVNRVLGILALIALLILLWGGFQMVTAAGDDGKYDEGFKLLRQAAGGLLMIGVAWFIVSIIFYVINLVTK